MITGLDNGMVQSRQQAIIETRGPSEYKDVVLPV